MQVPHATDQARHVDVFGAAVDQHLEPAAVGLWFFVARRGGVVGGLKLKPFPHRLRQMD